MFLFQMITTIHLEDFSPGICYDICGLMNAPIFKKEIKNGTRQRLGMMLPSGIQAVIDFVIYNQNDEPVFPAGMGF